MRRLIRALLGRSKIECNTDSDYYGDRVCLLQDPAASEGAERPVPVPAVRRLPGRSRPTG